MVQMIFWSRRECWCRTHPIARSPARSLTQPILPTTTEYAKFCVIVCWPLPLFHSSLHIHKFWVFAVKCIERRHEFVIFRWCINRYGGQCVSRTFAARHFVSRAPPAATTSNHGVPEKYATTQPHRHKRVIVERTQTRFINFKCCFRVRRKIKLKMRSCWLQRRMRMPHTCRL